MSENRGFPILIFLCFLTAILAVPAPCDPAIEDKVLSLMNTVRTKSGLPALKADSHLKESARMHLTEFVKNQEISIQYADEPALQDRLKMANVLCGSTGEIMLKVSNLDAPAEQLFSKEHKDILLNPKMSAANVVAEQSGDSWFIVADLIQPLQELSPAEVEKLVVSAIQDLRRTKNIMPLNYSASSRLRSTACEMAKKDTLKVYVPNPTEGGSTPGSASPILRNFAFTNLDPRELPQSIVTMPQDPKINSIAVGTCFASSTTYPNGIYWIVIQFYGTGLGRRF
jgi:hypothetical protein